MFHSDNRPTIIFFFSLPRSRHSSIFERRRCGIFHLRCILTKICDYYQSTMAIHGGASDDICQKTKWLWEWYSDSLLTRGNMQKKNRMRKTMGKKRHTPISWINIWEDKWKKKNADSFVSFTSHRRFGTITFMYVRFIFCFGLRCYSEARREAQKRCGRRRQFEWLFFLLSMRESTPLFVVSPHTSSVPSIENRSILC